MFEIFFIVLYFLNLIEGANSGSNIYCSPCRCENKVINCSSSIVHSRQLNSLIVSTIIRQNSDNYERIDLSGQQFVEIDVKIFMYAVNITDINFSSNKIIKIHPYAFKYATNLTKINLSSNELTSIPEDIFKTNINLKEVWLNNNKLTDLRRHTFVNLTNLRTIHLNNNEIKKIENLTFVNVTSLLAIDLKNNKLTTLDLNIFDSIENIKVFDLNKNPWICDKYLCPLITTAKRKDWVGNDYPHCYYPNGTETKQIWNDTFIVEDPKIYKDNYIIKVEYSTCNEINISQSIIEYKNDTNNESVVKTILKTNYGTESNVYKILFYILLCLFIFVNRTTIKKQIKGLIDARIKKYRRTPY